MVCCTLLILLHCATRVIELTSAASVNSFGVAKEGDMQILEDTAGKLATSHSSDVKRGSVAMTIPCKWVHVQTGVDVSLDCNRSTPGRWLKMILRSKVKLMEPPNNSSVHFSVGFFTAAKTWNYRRAFTRCLGVRATRNRPKYRSTAVRGTYFDDNSYQLVILLPECTAGSKKVKVYVYGGIEHCSTALEGLEAAELHDDEGRKKPLPYG
jgi:hypothetical protein